jgi:Ser/Thr protein kinase RdoA (MazF antagonist)
LDRIQAIREFIASNYDIVGPLGIELLADEGNSVFRISKGQQQYIFRLFAIEKSTEVIKSEIELLGFLSTHGLNVESPIVNSSGTYNTTIIINNLVRNCAMYKALNGIIYDEILTQEQARQFGLLISKFHNTLDLYTGQNSFREFGYEELVWMPWRTIKPYIQHNNELMDFYRTVIAESESKLRNNDGLFSWGICHGDLHAGNVIFNEYSEPCIFDFDLSCNSWRLYDLATIIWSILPREDYSQDTVEIVDICVKSFVEGYTTNIPLAKEEHELLFIIVLLRHIWRQAVRIMFENAVEWTSEQHFTVQMNRMKKWIEIYGINIGVNLGMSLGSYHHTTDNNALPFFVDNL